MKYKYVMFTDKHGKQFPVIFPEHIAHSEISAGVQHAVRSSELAQGLRDWSCPKPTSAGFIDTLHVEYVYGDSETLGLKAAAKDHLIIVNGDQK